MVDLAATDLTLTPDDTHPLRIGPKLRGGVHKVAFGDGALTYPSGGVPLPGFASWGLTRSVSSFSMRDTDDGNGLTWKLDHASGKIRAYVPAKPSLIVEEVVTIASNTGTLAEIPLYIIACEVTAGTTTGAFNIIPTGETPITKQCAVTFTSGVLTFLGTDAVTSVRVSYIPEADAGPWVRSNLVVDESVTAAAAKADFAARACLVQYIWNDTNSKLLAMEPPGEAPSATNTGVLDINDSSDTSVDTHADDDGDTLKVTYVKFAALEDASLFIDDTDITLDSEAYGFTENGHYPHIVIPGFGTQLVGEESGGANAIATWEGPSGTAANTVATWNPFTNAILTNNSTAMVTTAISWVLLASGILSPSAQMREVASSAYAPLATVLYVKAEGW
tara:strand:- start:442 stop:1614 length:1173 start_codon:yes stop_codon:yes gene_type:complete